MLSSDVSALCTTLLRFNLVSQSQLDECLGEFRHAVDAVDPLLDCLARKNYLTSYQISQLRKGDTAGLRLGDYLLLYKNASGSFARVWRARSVRDGEMVGLKVLRQRWAEDPKAVVQFRREAELGKSLKHENIVPIYEVAQDGNQHFFSMEFVEGGNLRDFIIIRKQLSPVEATKCTLEMAAGLHYALGKGLTHRDLKMTNVLMSSRGVAKLVDFGLAGLDPTAAGASGGSESAQRALEYATLEKGTNVPRNDPRSDLYFLGAIYYELLTGVPPLPRTRDRQERSQFARYAGVRPISKANPSLPRCVTKIVERLMEVNPHARYQTPGEVIADLRSALAELSGAAAAAGQPGARSATTVMCIEGRAKHQDLLRKYLSKHGYRVLMLSDLQRGLDRIRENPPDCVVVMGEALGDAAERGFSDMRRMVGKSATLCLLVLGEDQAELKDTLPQTDRIRVLQQPLRLRELNHEIQQGLERRSANGPSSEGNGEPTAEAL